MPHFLTPVRSRSASRRRSRRYLELACDCLELRDLPSTNWLSQVFQSSPPSHPKTISISFPPGLDGRSFALYQLSLAHHPLYQSIKNGHVLKAPLFLPGYTKPKPFDLAAAGAVARITPSGQLVLRGKVLGPIGLADPLVYSFLINRGGATPPGPLPDRPGITYDAVVSVRIGVPTPQGTVSLLNPQGQVTSVVALPANDVQITGTDVKVELPISMLPPTGGARSQRPSTGYSFAFQAAVVGGQPNDVAGVVPEFFNAPVGTSGAHP